MSYPELPQNQTPQNYQQIPGYPADYPLDPNFENHYQQVMYFQDSPEQMQGQKLAQTSFIFGIISLFVAGFIFGPLAIWKANEAEKLNVAATGGKVMGWISTIITWGAILLIVILLIMRAMGSSLFEY